MITYDASLLKDSFLNAETSKVGFFLEYSQKACYENSEYTSGMHPLLKKNNGKMNQAFIKIRMS